ncbi:PIG-L deacetylase family protein [Streptomyces sp. CA-181903]|uniref:PIG-L deacetylase family protein n=1 Tax=Streptomyces sp. CA-181903 TaxID=3240055 RepID=UPI003D91AE53
MPTVLFSPHMDDVVLSAAVCLMRPGAELVTVFAGSPPASVGLTHWDRFTRARSSAERHEQRIAEDDRAMAALGVTYRRLDEVDNQYREKPLDEDALALRLGVFVEQADEVWVPAAIGGHPDHVAVRDAVLAATDRMRDRRPGVVLYGDQPYSLFAGWPTWITGEKPAEFLDPDYWLESELAAQGFHQENLTGEFVELSVDQRCRKQAAVLCYRSQLAALPLDPRDTRRWESFLRYEIAWRLAPMP